MSLLLLFRAALAVPVVSYASPATVAVHVLPTFNPSNSGGAAASYEEVAGATNVLADANLKLDASTGVIDAIDAGGATPAGDYAFKIRGVNASGNGTTFDFVLHVVVGGSDAGDGVGFRALGSRLIGGKLMGGRPIGGPNVGRL